MFTAEHVIVALERAVTRVQGSPSQNHRFPVQEAEAHVKIIF